VGDRRDFAEDDALKERIKRSLTSIDSIVTHLGLMKESVKNSRGRVVRCPWHSEHAASCGLTIGEAGTLRAKCFSCDGKGDIFAFLAAAYGLDLRTQFQEVLGYAADLAGITLPDRAPQKPKMAQLKAVEPKAELRPKATLAEEVALGRALTLLQNTHPITSDQRIADGLAGRGLLEAAVKDGWSLLPRVGVEALLQAPGYEALRPILLREDKHGRPTLMWRDHRLIIPWRCPDGSPWSFQRRFAPHTGSEDPKQLGSPNVPKYVWPGKSVWMPLHVYPYGADHHSALDARTTEAWGAEGAPDVLSLRRLNEEGALSKQGLARPAVFLGLPGTQTLNDFMPGLAELVRGKRWVVAVDNDKAGRAVVADYLSRAEALGATGSRQVAPPGKDWNLLLQDLR